MKQYLLSIYQPFGEGPPPPPEFLQKVMRDVYALRDEMKAAGVWVFAGGLCAPDTATVIRHQGQDALITDGPFVDLKEHLGGFTVIRCADLDEALTWGRKLGKAVLPLPIEVRPFKEESPA